MTGLIDGMSNLLAAAVKITEDAANCTLAVVDIRRKRNINGQLCH